MLIKSIHQTRDRSDPPCQTPMPVIKTYKLILRILNFFLSNHKPKISELAFKT